MKLRPYRDILAMAKEKVDDALAPIRANRAKKQAELEIAKLDEKIASLEAKVTELCCAREIDFSALIEKLDECAIAQRKRGQFEKIIKEMFPGK